MNIIPKDMENIPISDDLDFSGIKHNPIDFASFKKSQEAIDERMDKISSEQKRNSIAKNLQAWDTKIVDRWRHARLLRIKEPLQAKTAARKAYDIIKDNNDLSNFFLYGAPGSGKTYIGYAILRTFIGKGFIGPSHIKIISESQLLGLASRGFDGSRIFSEILNNQFKVYLFDGISNRPLKDKELQLWEQMIDHVYSLSLTAIFTSNYGTDSFSERLTDSCASKFKFLIGNNVLNVGGEVLTPHVESDSDSEKKEQEKALEILEGFSE